MACAVQDIDNAGVEAALLSAVADLVEHGLARVDAIIFEAISPRMLPPSGQLTGRTMAQALSRLQTRQGYHAFRLAHHVQSRGHLEPWYVECFAVRAMRYALHIHSLSDLGWFELLMLRADARKGRRADAASFLLTKEAMGRGTEAAWNSDSMKDEPQLSRCWNATPDQNTLYRELRRREVIQERALATSRAEEAKRTEADHIERQKRVVQVSLSLAFVLSLAAGCFAYIRFGSPRWM